TICRRCSQNEPPRRYGSAHAIGEDLRRFLPREPIQARPVGALDRLWRWCRRNPALAAATGFAASALVAIAVLSVSYGIDRSRTAEQLREALGDAETQRGLTDRANADLRQNQSETQAA